MMVAPTTNELKIFPDNASATEHIRSTSAAQNHIHRDAARTILVVGLPEDVFDAVAAEFDKAGFTVTHVRTAGEAYAKMACIAPCVIIANVELPDESGWLLAGKTGLSHPLTCIWLWDDSESSNCDEWAELISAEPIIHNAAELYRKAAQLCGDYDTCRISTFERI